MRSIFGFCAVLPLFCACIGNSVEALKPTGESANIVLSDAREIDGEMLCLNDTSLCVTADGKIVNFPFTSIEKITLHDFDNKNIKAAFGLPMIIVDVLMLGAMSSDSGHGTASWTAAFGASAVLLGYSIVKETQYGLFKKPFIGDTVKRLKLFCRYPAGLTQAQWKSLLEQDPPESVGLPSAKP